MSQQRRGEMLFADAMMCFQQWQSCSTCHPDVRTDAVNWDLLNDGIGNPKSTKSLVLSHQTPPVMISGIRDSAETAVRAGIRYIQFAVPEEERADAIEAYLKALVPVPSPFLVKGKLSKAARQGAKIFLSANCAACHSGEYYTNGQKYDVGTGEGMEEGREFATPTLVEVWRSGPYLYDGRAATLKDIFKKFNKNDAHGRTSGLSAEELSDLTRKALGVDRIGIRRRCLISDSLLCGFCRKDLFREHPLSDMAEFIDTAEQLVDNRARVCDHTDLDVAVPPDLCRILVDVDDPCIGMDPVPVAGPEVPIDPK